MRGRPQTASRRPTEGSEAGFSLAEVVVALLVLEVGVLGVAGLLALSGRVLTRGMLEERAVYAAEGAVDSLTRVGRPLAGSRAFPGGRIRWTTPPAVEGLRRVRIRAVDAGGRSLLSLEALLPPDSGRSGTVPP